jgi:hypothetical protein
MNMTPRTKIFLALSLVALGVAGRLLPHAWNFAPIVAIGLFAGAYLDKRLAFITPVAAMLISDSFIGFYEWRMNLIVYVAMALAGGVGILLRRRKNPITIGAAAMLGSTLFFLITNAAVWYFGSSYDPGIKGLFASLVAGLPFFRNAIVGDVWYSFALFGVYELALAAIRSHKIILATSR